MGVSEIRPFGSGDIKSDSQFFDTSTGRQVARPGDADSVAEAMRLRTYRKLNEVPFFAMLGDKRGPR